MTNDLILFGLAAAVFLVIAGLGFALPGGSNGDRAVRRLRTLDTARPTSRLRKVPKDESAARRKKTQAMLNKLREQGKAQRQTGLLNTVEAKLMQAGLNMTPKTFWLISLVLGSMSALGTWYSGAEGPPPILGIEIKSQPAMIVAALIGGGLGLPHWVLAMLAKRRNKKLLSQFADGIDIIVRGVKSGLPLTECLRIIARESPAPLGPEFAQLTDNIQMGTAIDRALQQFYKRVPLPEVNFFVIVLSIQAKSGGNLSEALGNLSTVIRSRKMMREKIKALSSEAKASSMIIGALPFAVAFMVYLTTPDYIMDLFITSTGHMILFMSTCLMAIGIAVMRKMISFDI